MNLNISENELNERKPLLEDLNEINHYVEDENNTRINNEQEPETYQNSEFNNRNATQFTSSSMFFRNVQISDEHNLPLHRVN